MIVVHQHARLANKLVLGVKTIQIHAHNAIIINIEHYILIHVIAVLGTMIVAHQHAPLVHQHVHDVKTIQTHAHNAIAINIGHYLINHVFAIIDILKQEIKFALNVAIDVKSVKTK